MDESGVAALSSVLNDVPPVDAAFAYGSGVFRQPNLYDEKSGKQPMLDFVFVVESPQDWHKQNMEANKYHYSGLAAFGPKWVDIISRHIGVGVHFNTLVSWQNKLIKYGVTSLADFKHDLTTWDHLYLSGRLQKPVLWLKTSDYIQERVHYNLEAASAASLLLLPQDFCEKEFFRMLCGLSYSGDVRMNLAEDSSKIDRIVQGSAGQLRSLYMPKLEGPVGQCVEIDVPHAGAWQQLATYENRLKLLEFLPKGIVKELDSAKVLHKHSLEQGSYHSKLLQTLANRVANSSRRQAVAGLLAVGALKSSRYVWEKLKKAWNK